MKKILFYSKGKFLTFFSLFALLLTHHASAQLVSSYYNFSQSTGTYTPITGGTLIVANTDPSPSGNDSAAIDDYTYTPTTIPFSFTFNGTAYTQVNISSNGWISFGSGSYIGSDGISGSGGNFSGVISGMGMDLMGPSGTLGDVTSGSSTIANVGNTTNCTVGAKIQGTGIPANTTITAFTANSITMSANATSTNTATFISWTAGEIRVGSTGTSPNRTFIIQYSKMAIYSNSTFSSVNNTGVNFQIQLSEGGGVATAQTISIVFGSMFMQNTASRTVEVGLRGATTADFNNRTGTGSWGSSTAGVNDDDNMTFASATLPASGLTYTWTPATGCSGTPTAGTAAASVTMTCVGTPFTLSVTGNSSNPGITFQWQSSPASAGTFTDITGATTATYIIPNQTAATDYRLKVTCTNGGAFANTNVVTVTVPPAPTVATLPYTQSFESWVTSCYTTQLPDNNWVVAPATGDNSWRRDDQGASGNWGNTGNGTYSPVFVNGAHSARFHTWNAPDGDTGIMDLHINLSPAGNKEISFYYMNEDGDDSLQVLVSSDGGATFSSLGVLKTSATWTPSVFTTSSTAANAIVRFLAVSDYGGTDIGMDSLVVKLPSCPAPTALTATPAANGTNATLGWSQAGTPPQWQVQYGVSGFPIGTGTSQSTTTASITLTTLSPGTPYAYYVRAICGSGDTSSWAGPFSFTTLCPAAVSLPYVQTFDAFLPGCWTEALGYLGTATVLSAGTTNWYPNYYLNGTSDPAVDINLYSTGINDWLISPSIDLGTSGNTTLSFNFGVTEFFGPTPEQLGSDDSVAFVISTDNGATWDKSNIVKVFTAANTPVNTATGGQRFSIPLTGYTGIVKIGIYATEGSVNDPTDNDIFVDSLLVSACTLPSADSIIIGGTVPTLSFSAHNPQNVTTYNWDFGDNNSSIIATPTHTYQANGNYTIRLIVTNSCGSDTITRDIMITGISVNTVTLGNNELTLYPNPASSSVTIDNKSTMFMQSVSITNSVGAVVLRERIDSKTENIPLSGLAPGIYSVLIQMDKGTVVRKLTILR